MSDELPDGWTFHGDETWYVRPTQRWPNTRWSFKVPTGRCQSCGGTVPLFIVIPAVVNGQFVPGDNLAHCVDCGHGYTAEELAALEVLE